MDRPGWRHLWNLGFGLGSAAVAFLLGVAFGNLLRGIPIDENGVYTGSFIGLLNPYALLTGIISLTLFTMHGAIYMCLKSNGVLHQRMKRWATRSWILLALLYLIYTIATFFVLPHLYKGGFNNFLFWFLFLLLLSSITYLPVALQNGKFVRAFFSSSCTILSMIGLAAVGMFPALAPSNIEPSYSLTIYNSSSTPLTLRIMLIIALIGMPLVIAYTCYIYRIFKGKAVVQEDGY